MDANGVSRIGVAVSHRQKRFLVGLVAHVPDSRASAPQRSFRAAGANNNTHLSGYVNTDGHSKIAAKSFDRGTCIVLNPTAAPAP